MRTADMTLDAGLIRMLELQRFYYDEAALIENGDYKAWLGLLADDVSYVMPQRDFADRRAGRQLDHIGAHLFEEDRASLERRATFLLSGPSPEVPRPFRRLLVTNVRLLSDEPASIEAESKFLFWEMPASGRAATFIGLRRDVLRPKAEGLRIAKRTILLDTPVLPRAAMSFF